jgi:Tol biopolymer transport system component
VVYFAEPGVDETGNPIGGLYMLDFKVGLQYRLFAIDNLNPRGIPGHVPVWSADGSRLAIVLPTEYATDIFLMNADGSNFRNLTDHGSYDLYPAFSPDGLWLAFVSDRLQCPTWTPGEVGSCAQLNAPAPQEGNLFVMNLNTGEVRQVTDVRLNGAPYWITPTKLEFSTGGGNALSTQSQLWLVDVEAGSAVQISPADAFSISQSWTDDAGRVVYQRATTSTDIVVADNLARDLAVTSEYAFPRYGMTADWSASGEYLAIGGRNGQCPYGIIVTDPNLEIITAPAQNLLACDPVYAPSSPYLAYTAIRPGIITDGSLDIYIGNLNGLGASNITFDLQGQNRLLGWVGISPP